MQAPDESLLSETAEYRSQKVVECGGEDKSPLVMVKPLEVLLIEDNPGDVHLIRQALKSEPFPTNLRVAMDGEQAIQILEDRQFKPDLVILDLNLPKVSGFSVLDRCRPEAPVVIFTSSSSPDDLLRSFKLGAREYVKKPTDLDEFTKVVSQMVRNWGSRDGLTGSAS